MKKLCFVGCILAAAQVLDAAPFQNLGFDDANTNNLVNGIWGAPEDLLTGWTISPSQKAIGVNAITIGSGYVSLWSGNGIGSIPPAEGRFLLDFDGPPGFAEQWTLSQTADIPIEARAIHFISSDAHVSLTLNGADVPLVYVPRRINLISELNDVYGDISAFAGQTVDMAFTTSITVGRLDAGLDSIAFVVPEPAPWALLVLAGIVAAAALSIQERSITTR
jgi:hypothetical protein